MGFYLLGTLSHSFDLNSNAVALLASVVLVISIPNIALSQSADPFEGIEEMVVTADSSSAILQSQEISVVGFDADYLEALGANDLSDIAQFTPNLEIRTPFAASNPTLFIRGVGLRDFNANSSSSVAVYNDDIYMNSPAGQLAQLFDVQNIDVLRGPQGGIYGRNASAGAIRVITRKPTGNSTGASASMTYGRFGQLDIQGAAESVLIPDTVSMRIAGKVSKRGGTAKNRCGDQNFASAVPGAGNDVFEQRVYLRCFNVDTTGDPLYGGLGWIDGERAPVKERVNDTDNWAARAITRFQFDFLDGLDILVNFHGGQNRGDARSFQMIGASQRGRDIEPTISNSVDTRDFPQAQRDTDNELAVGSLANTSRAVRIRSPFIGRPFEGEWSTVGKEKLDLFGSNVVSELSNGNWTYKLILGYEWNDRDAKVDLDGTARVALEPRLENSAWQMTGEARASWDAGEGLSFELAAMYLYESLDVSNEFELTSFDIRFQEYTFRTNYGSVYGELEWELSEFLTLGAGGRFNYEDKELNLHGEAYNAFFLRLSGPGVEPLYTQDEMSQATEFGWAGDVTISYLPSNDVTFYIKYAHGWKGPHINGLVLGPATTETGDPLTTPVKPEEVDSIELGVKSLFWDSRIKMNAALFLYDYKELQVFRLRNSSVGLPTNELINADDADVLGVEFDIDIRPFEGIGPPILEGFNLFASFSWIDNSYTEFVNRLKLQGDPGPDGQPTVTTTTVDFSGKQLVNSPEFAFVGYAMWPLPTKFGIVIPRFDWSFKDDVFFSPENSPLVGQSALWLMNFRLIYKSPTDNFEISGWVENMTDQSYTVDTFNLARFRGSILHAIGDPRTYGVTMKVTF